MLSPASLLRILSELVFVLLGLLVVQVALSGRFFWNRRSPVWIGLGVFLIYWGLRAGLQASRSPRHREAAAALVRGASLVLVGAAVLGLAWVPVPYVAPLLLAVGGVLALRGVVSIVLVARS